MSICEGSCYCSLMSRDTRQFASFLVVLLVPSALAGVVIDTRWGQQNAWLIFAVWLAAILGGTGFIIDGKKGAADSIIGTGRAWLITLSVGLLIGSLAAAKFGHSL
ncbi:hypothetical protein GAO09_19300 [Rhizobiales bacterium RZME27]|uniref:Uncharacterized protein n=1 Tax=Endobacterium cereale TaxID=2663029 RepID=A0A6A8AA94_9HYPH|nr:hypothetical protein [Endobacterium cereale]MQY48185.1 hypothetical protein [Endobacterium cereale]